MSVRNVAQARADSIPLPLTFPQPWVRNPSWVAMPSVADTEQKFVALFAVYPSGNIVAFTAAGDYTVDWGDGTTQNFASGVTAEREISYSAAALANTDAPVTLTDAGDLVERTAHGYVNGMAVQFFNIATTTGLTAGQTYYVINATTNTFQVSTTVGGSAVTLTNNGTATLLQYKQTLITVTPQAGQNLTSLNLQVRHSAAGTTTYTVNYLDTVLSAPNMTTLRVGSSTATDSTFNVQLAMMARCRILSLGSVGAGLSYLFNTCLSLRVAELRGVGSATDFSSMFRGCFVLTDVSLSDTAAITTAADMFRDCAALSVAPSFNTSSVTNMSNMFRGCSSLTAVPLYNTVATTNMSGTFFSCLSLRSVPLFNTASVTTMDNMFNSCRVLTSVPLFNTMSVTNMNLMFAGCVALIYVPLFNTAAVTNMSGMFSNCNSLLSVPLFNSSSVTNMSSMFSGCFSLTSVPPFNTGAVTNMSTMFFNCYSLNAVPLFNTAAVTNMQSMFGTCVSLASVPEFNTAVVTNMSAMFSGCRSLVSIPALNGNAATASSAYSNIFSNCFALARSEVTNFKFSHSYVNCKLSAAELDAIYTRLPTVTGQTITVTGNYGTAGDNPTIATAKGWTVTG